LPKRFTPKKEGDFAAQLAIITLHMLRFMSAHKILVRLIFSGNEDDRAYLKALRDDSNSTFVKLNGFFQIYQAAGRISARADTGLLTTNLFGMIHAQAVVAPSEQPLDIDATSRSICQLFQSLTIGENDA